MAEIIYLDTLYSQIAQEELIREDKERIE